MPTRGVTGQDIRRTALDFTLCAQTMGWDYNTGLRGSLLCLPTVVLILNGYVMMTTPRFVL